MKHRHIAMITGPLHLTNARERMNGFKRAMQEAKLPVSLHYIQEATFDKQGGHAKAMILLRMVPRPTAFFAGNDMIALGILLAVREIGLRCPQDISVLGFDNLDFAETTSPSLSSVHQSGYQLGATAARIVFDRVSGDTGPPKHFVLETELKIRESVAPFPDDGKSKLQSRTRPPKKKKCS
jgi:LacI family transcriptional regulator, galactose operon repressor